MNELTVAQNPYNGIIFHNIKTDPLIHAMTQMTLKTVILREISQFLKVHSVLLQKSRKCKIIYRAVK